ncbi:PEP-CTERM sorting domain-containing protein [Pseudoduganella sp. OTU4001]|uniref:PEP-CTERM sorting domain-containing protein n=1 Tax=Pseudoduganella sp. OTU4001 TaxID=3043854 RepID=UPI00313ABAC4
MKKFFAVAALLSATQAGAGVLNISLTDIGQFSGTRNTNTAASYAGTGYIGMYSNAWGHVFGAERSNLSRTLMQVDIAELAGKTISSAFLSFDLLDGDSGNQAGTVVGFDAGAGQLAFSWNAPTANYGSVAATLVGRGTSTIDITSLLAASVAAQDDWFGLHLRGSTRYQWTSTANDADRAHMRLTVNYEDAVPVTSLPEPASPLLIGVALLGLACVRRKRTIMYR